MFVIASDINNLKITEIHYNPLPEDTLENSSLEFIELKNIGTSPIDLSGTEFTNGINYSFDIGSIIYPGKFIVLSSNHKNFMSRYGFSSFGEYSGSLDNSGERIEFASVSGDTVISIRYNDKAPWPIEADGTGYSLVSSNINPTENQNDGNNWIISAMLHGSPGKDDDNTTDLAESTPTTLSKFSLEQNYPNPFNPVTTINYSFPASSYVTLIVYNMLGQEIEILVNKEMQQGSYKVNWNAQNLSSGVYFYKLSVNNKFEIKKMLLLK